VSGIGLGARDIAECSVAGFASSQEADPGADKEKPRRHLLTARSEGACYFIDMAFCAFM
jgi:hypothetical protein